MILTLTNSLRLFLTMVSCLSLLCCTPDPIEPLPDQTIPAPTPTDSVTVTMQLDTIFPSSYIPAYPGSYWKYSDGTSISTDSVYRKAAILTTSGPFARSCHKTGIAFLPSYNGSLLSGYTSMNESYTPCTTLLISETEETEWTAGETGWTVVGDQYGGVYAKMLAVDTTITLRNGDTYTECIVIREWYEKYGGEQGVERFLCYAKNVGRLATYHVMNPDTAIGIELVEYYIAI